MKLLLFIISMLLLLSCRNKPVVRDKKDLTVTVLDTIIKADSMQIVTNCSLGLTNETAKTALKEYFIPKNYYDEKTLSLDSLLNTNTPNEPRCFDMFKLYKLPQRQGSCEIGIITYYKCACFKNGNHVRPHIAMIAPNSSGKYIVVNEDFLPDYFGIDSVKTLNNTIYIYGAIIDRSQQTGLKPYRAQINRK